MVYLVFSAVTRKLEMYLGMVATQVNKILQKHNNHSKCLRIFKRKESVKTVRFSVVFLAMSDDSFNNPSKGERQRRRRKRASKNLEEFNGDANLSASAPASKGRGLALHDLPNQKTPGYVKNPSSGNSNSLEMNDERRRKSRKSRKRAPRQGAGTV